MSMSITPQPDFEARHIGPSADDLRRMLDALGAESLDQLIRETVPDGLLVEGHLDLPDALPEHRLIERLREIASRNRVLRSYIGMGYHGTHLPAVIQRNVLENPGWYTQYTPYQAEIAQGRLEALLNFQTMVSDLTGMDLANASLLDEGTAAAEAMSMLAGATRDDRPQFFVSDECHPQTIAVVETRAEPLDIEVIVGDWTTFEPDERCFGALLSYPTTSGAVHDYAEFTARVHDQGAGVAVVADLLSLTLLTPPGEWGADIVVGNTQRFGVPMGYGGPHAAFMSARDTFKRRMPGRLIGVSVDAQGNRALRMALQTREQHIRREKATSNICTAQVLLAVIAGFYGVYHGPTGLRRIAERVHALASTLAEGLERLGHELIHADFFDTVRVRVAEGRAQAVLAAALERGINLRDYADGTLGIALDETVEPDDLDDLFAAFSRPDAPTFSAVSLAASSSARALPDSLRRTSAYMDHPVFESYHSETEMLRYIHRLESKDLSLNTSMIPLGSCTMKLNATTEMAGVTWPEFGALHPFAPVDQAQGYQELFDELSQWLAEITGFTAVSLQPNSGAQGEYTGLQVIRAYHRDRGEAHRNVCLIPSSAHGTNPASAVMAGMKVVVVESEGADFDLDDLRAKAEQHADQLAAIMVTYPSTHGVFEDEIREVCDIVHQNGGLVYLDGANLNAQVGLMRPADYGADVCHINLHKTFAIPHGGGGPGMGPICVNDKLAPFLPGHPIIATGGDKAIGPVSAAPWGSSSILVISWAYIALLGASGVRRATEVALLNANYMARRLEEHYDVLFVGSRGRVAHEFILDLRPFRKSAGITEEDVAKRLQDYGFHGPTMSWPVVGTVMVEPTESESLAELDRFCDAMISIRAEIQQVELGIADAHDNALKHAPHTAAEVTADDWAHAYTRSQAAFPAPWTKTHKFWPTVGRVDNAYGDRNLVCSCPPVEAYAAADMES